ncbi:MAG: hypothetical protein WBB19_10895 [Desulforhopalus sp.]
MTYIPKYFKPHELVDPVVYEALAANTLKICRLFDNRVLVTADALRRRFGPMRINDWFWGGRRKDSGYRSADSGIGALWSEHKFGRALDPLFTDCEAEYVRQEILRDPFHPDFKYITCLEMTISGKPISWLHFATRNWDKRENGIQQLHLH